MRISDRTTVLLQELDLAATPIGIGPSETNALIKMKRHGTRLEKLRKGNLLEGPVGVSGITSMATSKDFLLQAIIAFARGEISIILLYMRDNHVHLASRRIGA